MTEQSIKETGKVSWWVLAVGSVGLAALIWPMQTWETTYFVINGFVTIAPMVVPGILLAAWIIASGADGYISQIFEGRLVVSVLARSPQFVGLQSCQ